MPERKTLNRTYSVGDQVPTCPVFTRAKIKSRFGILVDLPSQYHKEVMKNSLFKQGGDYLLFCLFVCLFVFFNFFQKEEKLKKQYVNKKKKEKNVFIYYWKVLLHLTTKVLFHPKTKALIHPTAKVLLHPTTKVLFQSTT